MDSSLWSPSGSRVFHDTIMLEDESWNWDVKKHPQTTELLKTEPWKLSFQSEFWRQFGTVFRQENWAIAKMTVRCTQYMSALKIVCKCKISRRLRKNLHITILSLFGSEIIFEVFQPMWSRCINITDRQTTCNLTTALCVASRGKNWHPAFSSGSTDQ